MTTRRSYRHIDKDPIIDIVRTACQLAGRSLPDIAACAGISPVTLKNWLYGDIKRPQNVTVELVLCELGISREARWIANGKLVQQSSSRKLRVVK